MNKAEEKVNEIICSHIAITNLAIDNNSDDETILRLSNELKGMLICLRNIAKEGRAYYIFHSDKHIEFGYYEEKGNWVVLEK